MKRLSRWLCFALVSVLLLGVAGLVGLRLYLGGERGRNLLVEQLTKKLGEKVELDRFVVSTFGSSRVFGLRVFDGDTGKTFLEADEVDVDLSALGLLLGRRTPHRLDVEGGHLRLAFDPSGKLLTQMPKSEAGGPAPRLHITDGRLTLEQQGRPPLVLDHLNLAMSSKKQDNITGTLDDPMFGKFDITGHSGDAMTVALHGVVPRITPEMLRGLPFVPVAVWQQVEAEGADVPLDLEFTFQKKAPELRYKVGFAKARCRLLQPDRPPLEVYPSKGVMQGSEGDFVLEGNINDAYWGDWAVRVTDKDADRAIKIMLKTASVQVDQKKLEKLPYVPKHIWQEFGAEGKTAAEVNVRIPSGPADVSYRVDLDVPRATVTIPAIALKATDASGKVRVEDGLVKLDKVKGKVAKGEINTTGELDFRKDPSKLTFAIAIKGVGLRDLPAKWGLAEKKIDGKLSGKANLVLTLHENGMETRGSGEGQIDDAKVLGFRASEPIKINLHGDGKRLHFNTSSKVFSALFLTLPVYLPPADPNPLADLAGQALGGVEVVTRKIAQGTHDALRLVGKIEKPFRSKETSYLDAKVNLEDIDMTELTKRLNLALPFELSGRMSIKMVLGIPINNANDLRDYRLNGSATSPRLVIAGVELRDAKAHVDYARGVLRLTDLSGKVPSGTEVGTFSGSARMGIVPRRELSFDGKIDRLPAEAVAQFIPSAQKRVTGLVSGQVSARVAVDNLNDPAAWDATAQLTSPDITAFGLHLSKFSVGAVLAKGKGSLRDLTGELYKGKLTGSAKLDLAGKGSYEANFSVRGADLAEPGAMLPKGFALKGTGDLSGVLHGTTNPMTLAGSGAISTHAVRLGKIHVDDLASNWTLDGDLLRLTKLTGKLYKGDVAGAVEVRLLSTAGKVKIRLVDLDSAVLAKAIEGVPLKMSGKVTADATVSFAPKDGKTQVTSDINLTAANLRLQGIMTRKVRGKLDWKGDNLNYRLEGEALGGKFSVDGIYPPAPRAPAGQSHGHIRLDRILIERLVQARRLGDHLRPLTGLLTIHLPFRFDGVDKVVDGRGRFEVADLRWNDSELTDLVRGNLHVHNGRMTVREITGTVAGGLLRAAGAYRFTGTQRGWFNINLNAAEARRLLEVVGMKDKIQGPIDVSLRGKIGDEWRGSGAVLLRRGKVAGVAITDWRMPLEFTFDPETGQTDLVIRESQAQVGHGRASLRADLHFGDTISAEGNLVLFDASLGALAGLIGDVSSYIKGQVTGRVDFAGSGMRSLTEVSANVRAKLREAQALQLPILRQLAPFVLRGQSWREFNRGALTGQLRGGIFRVDDLTLESEIAQLIIFGTITTAGRLDLDVTAHTVARGGNLFAAQRLARGLPALGSVPVAVLLSITNVLANELMHLRISGTVKSPVVTIQPLRTLSETAARLFTSVGVGGGR